MGNSDITTKYRKNRPLLRIWVSVDEFKRALTCYLYLVWGRPRTGFFMKIQVVIGIYSFHRLDSCGVRSSNISRWYVEAHKVISKHKQSCYEPSEKGVPFLFSSALFPISTAIHRKFAQISANHWTEAVFLLFFSIISFDFLLPHSHIFPVISPTLSSTLIAFLTPIFPVLTQKFLCFFLRLLMQAEIGWEREWKAVKPCGCKAEQRWGKGDMDDTTI